MRRLLLVLLFAFSCSHGRGTAPAVSPPSQPVKVEEPAEPPQLEQEETPKPRVIRLRCKMTPPPTTPTLAWVAADCPPKFIGCLDPADAALLQRYLRDVTAWTADVYERCHAR